MSTGAAFKRLVDIFLLLCPTTSHFLTLYFLTLYSQALMDGGLLVAQTLASQDVTALFTLCGGHIAPILVGCKRLGIKVIDTRHEVNAVFAADAVARLTGVPGVAAVTAGPGVTNTITAVKNAQLAQSPVILLGGATATVLKGRGSLQDIDQLSLIKPHVKWAVSVKRVRDIPALLKQAFATALSGVPGPVFVELPIDTLFPQHIIREWYGIKSANVPISGLKQRAVQWYLQRHLNTMFGGTESTEQAAALVPKSRVAGSIPRVAEADVRHVAHILARAERPVMVIGSQALLNAPNAHELARAVESIGVPVYLSGMARGLLGANHPLHLRHKRKEALQRADVVVLLGVPCDFRLDYGNHIGRSATLVSVNRSQNDLTHNRKPTVGLLGDPMQFALALSQAVHERPSSAQVSKVRYEAYLEELRRRDAERNAEIAEQAAVQYGEYLNPLYICQQFDRYLSPHSVIVADGGDFVATASYILNPRAPLSWYDPGVFGTLGVGAGFALGVRAVRPDAEVWIYYGDGSVGYSLAEFDTFARHKMGVIAVVGNDAGWTQIARDQVPMLGDDVGTVLTYTDYHIAAKGFGGDGLVLNADSDLHHAVHTAQRSAQEGVPFLLNALIGKTEFRKGSISM